MIIRWICEKCSKKWIYPVGKCVYCKGPVVKQKGTRLKVAGITKVLIPSPMHPIIPYNIVLLEDEHGNRMPRKTMKDYKIGDMFVEQKAKTNDAVSVVKVKYDIYEAIKEAIELLYNIELKGKIMIKPSCVTAAYSYQAVNTNPQFLDALIKALYDYGIKKEDIIVGEQSLLGSDSMDAASKAGIIEVCKKHGINFVDISKGPFERLEADGCEFNIFKEALHRTIINAPVMKTNFQLKISGALENLSRLADEQTQRKMFYDDIEETLPKLAAAIPNVITIADATNGLQGQGPLTLGEPAFLNLVMASKNAAVLDSSFCEMAMIEMPRYISSFGFNAKNLEIAGNELDALKYPLKQAIPNETAHPDIKVIDGKACPACLNLMNNLTSRLVGLRGDQINVVTGSVLTKEMIEGQERLVAIGDCAINKLKEMSIDIAKIEEKTDGIEQLVLLKKLLETKGTPKITPVDKVKSKMKKLLSRVIS